MITTATHTVIVLGCQRSGTTMSGQILGAHENAVMIDEFEGLYPWFHAQADQAPDAATLSTKVMQKSTAKYADRAARYVAQGGGPMPADHISHLVLKAPNLTFEAAKIARLTTQVRVIYPQRDPRAVVASMVRLSDIDFVTNQIKHLEGAPQVRAAFASDFDVLSDTTQPYWIRAAKVWKIKTGLVESFTAKGLPVLPLKYEDLVRNPDDMIPEILRFCDLPESQCAHHPESVYQGTGPGGTKRTRRIDTTAVERWSHELNADQTRDVMLAAAPLAEALGYV